MKVTTTAKIRIYPDEAASAALALVCRAYSDACSAVSGYMFETDQLECSAAAIHRQLYASVRSEHGLKSQMACSVFRTVRSAYDTIRTQYANAPYTFRCEGRRYNFPRDLEWLREPARFRKPFADLVRGRDWSFVTRDGELMLSVNTLASRVTVPFNHRSDEMMGLGCNDSSVRLGGAKLLQRKGKWYMHISVTREVPDACDIRRIAGHDRGLRCIVTSFDGIHTVFYDGSDIAAKRDRYHRTRKSLQSKNTRGAKRVLARISGRENRWMNDVNHCISKTLTRTPDTLHVLEDLRGISFNERNLTGRDRSRTLRNWSFYDLEQKIIYKAHLNGSEVIKVPPEYTSQRCPVCGYISKDSRDKHRHEFRCAMCGYTDNDDKAAAMNLRELGVRYLNTGKIQGFSKKDTMISSPGAACQPARSRCDRLRAYIDMLSRFRSIS